MGMQLPQVSRPPMNLFQDASSDWIPVALEWWQIFESDA
jgi:hypothetical protein